MHISLQGAVFLQKKLCKLENLLSNMQENFFQKKRVKKENNHARVKKTTVHQTFCTFVESIGKYHTFYIDYQIFSKMARSLCGDQIFFRREQLEET